MTTPFFLGFFAGFTICALIVYYIFDPFDQ